MDLKYVKNKSKFIDLSSRRPRLMNIQTTVKLLETAGFSDPHKEILYIMEEKSIILDTDRPVPPLYLMLGQYQVEAIDEQFIVQGLKLNLLEALEILIRRGLSKSDALRVLALAVDIANKKA